VGRDDKIGDQGASALFVRHRSQLVNYAGGLIGDWSQAEDLVQDAYLRFTSASPAQPVEEPVGYLYRIVRNLALDRHRRRQREARIIERDSGQADSVAEDRPSPETEAVHRAELRVLMAALDELPERTRIALEMHRFGGCKLREIAEHLGISSSTAHTLVTEGLAHCRRRLLGHRAKTGAK
jgi:RNA polymerase sigma-70 factor (ECF subfamily)